MRHDNKVLLYVMFWLKAVLKSVDFQFHHYAVKNTTTWGDYTRRHLTNDQVMADRKAHQKMHDELTALKTWMQHRYEEEADLELEILRRVHGDVDRLTVHCENRRRHPGNEDEYHMRQKLAEEQTKGRSAQGASNQECDQRRESESQERQQYAREREEQIEFQKSEPYPSPMSEPDPPTEPEPSSRGGAKAKMKVTLEDYRSRQLQKEAAKEKDKHDQESKRLLEEEQHQQRESIEAKKIEEAHLRKIKIRQAEVARIKHEQEQLRLEQERMWKEQEANATLLASQARQAFMALGSHTPCYDEHSQELDYHDDVPAAMDSQEGKRWSNYFRQQGDKYGVQLADSLDAEHGLLQGPTMTSTVSEEAVLLEEETPTMDMRQFLVGLETLTPAMLSELSTRIEHLCQLAAPLASTKLTQKESLPPPPGLPATLTCTQSHGAGPVESNEQPWNVTSPPAYAHMPSRCGRDRTRRRPSCRTNVKGTRNAVPEAEERLTCDKLNVAKTESP